VSNHPSSVSNIEIKCKCYPNSLDDMQKGKKLKNKGKGNGLPNYHFGFPPNENLNAFTILEFVLH